MSELIQSQRERRLDLAALDLFTSRLPAFARVLDAGCGNGTDLLHLLKLGFRAEGIDSDSIAVELCREKLPSHPEAVSCRDVRLFSAPPATYDAIWANRLLNELTPSECLRVMGIFFQIIKPGGWLYCSVRITDAFPENEFLALLRQNGFHPQQRGENREDPAEISVLSTRIKTPAGPAGQQ